MHWIGIDCGNPDEPANGTGHYIDTFVGSVVTYVCDSEFKLVGIKKRTCQLNGLWNGTVPVCQRKYNYCSSNCEDVNAVNLLIKHTTIRTCASESQCPYLKTGYWVFTSVQTYLHIHSCWFSCGFGKVSCIGSCPLVRPFNFGP